MTCCCVKMCANCGHSKAFQHGLCIDCVKSPEEYAELDKLTIQRLIREVREFDPEWLAENV